jgi:hypothetical protein
MAWADQGEHVAVSVACSRLGEVPRLVWSAGPLLFGPSREIVRDSDTLPLTRLDQSSSVQIVSVMLIAFSYETQTRRNHVFLHLPYVHEFGSQTSHAEHWA